ncbi:MAG TPA: thiosulfate oxidation carrier protein SoxY [Accumulibacter sp.]|uniref:thiosulfate oxidation carrier protein SoxY n=1 Tax=Accumulibacter sp. TaxID=2053492 RepID=UPI002879DFDB|nr:thiosulfate oxidation carrier protein SoxY [Accumulibacter sp.]MDS4055969.1 thiosulfate oxidation carrier protein SoxY [Accumulibacter sp.]HMV04185.1 thiosulfate oxidation carrier protein SoxY [Accumulibacter sp.]HMW62871.1 thiosulfate oxidation carrier protein SoxY [Accumulibacter sp.]HMW78969.1 thiosulfate oxidation carrier protein SoxY [Accumulibacter sp.]HMX68373.1 thiosulfate oxidation carrier protein SoxY [Accumulibacter sp.]
MSARCTGDDRLRRLLIKSTAVSAAVGALCAAGLLKPTRVLATEWGRSGFAATRLPEALKAIGAAASAESGAIVIKSVEISENGALVPCEVISSIPDTQSIAVLVERNPMPLAASLSFAEGVLPRVRLQLKMAESSRIRVVVRAGDGKTYHASREVRVTLGGCGA